LMSGERTRLACRRRRPAFVNLDPKCCGVESSVARKKKVASASRVRSPAFFVRNKFFAPSRPLAAPFQNSKKRTLAQLVNGQAGGERLFLRDGATGDAAQKEIQQTLPGGRVVEDIAEERGERRFLDERFEPAGSTR